MMIHSDVLEPVYIGGYASVFNRVYDIGSGVLESVAPGAFDLSGSIFATADHEDDRCFGRTDNGSLQIWSDSRGLAFRLALQNSWGAISLARSIVSGNYRHVSVNFASRRVERSIVAGVPVEHVVGATISELSLTGRPACESTAAWVSTEEADMLPPEIASSRAWWRAGRMAASVTKHLRQAGHSTAWAGPPLHVRDGIDRVLAAYRPDLLALIRA